MGIERTPEELTAIRHKYEHTDQPVEEIARDHRMGSRTLYTWARRWNWTPRHASMPAEGPPPTPPPPQIARAAPLLLPAPQEPPLGPAPADVPAMKDAPDSALLAPQILAPQILAPQVLAPQVLAPQILAPQILAPQTDAAPLAPMQAADATPGASADLKCDPGTPAALRLQGAVANVLAAIEAIVAKISTGRTAESDRSARALAALTRTLRELNTLQSQYEELGPDDDSPVDIDEFRRTLARKIDAFVAAQGGGVRDDAEPQGA